MALIPCSSWDVTAFPTSLFLMRNLILMVFRTSMIDVRDVISVLFLTVLDNSRKKLWYGSCRFTSLSFISLYMYFSILQVLKDHDLSQKYSVKEAFFELSNIYVSLLAAPEELCQKSLKSNKRSLTCLVWDYTLKFCGVKSLSQNSFSLPVLPFHPVWTTPSLVQLRWIHAMSTIYFSRVTLSLKDSMTMWNFSFAEYLDFVKGPPWHEEQLFANSPSVYLLHDNIITILFQFPDGTGQTSKDLFRIRLWRIRNDKYCQLIDCAY